VFKVKQVRIVTISGATYPINVYIADVNANNKTFIGVINSGPVPPTVTFNTSIPTIFQTASEVMLILTDNNGCEIFKILDCTYCIYQIIITEI
jgi:hypothetical protein